MFIKCRMNLLRLVGIAPRDLASMHQAPPKRFFLFYGKGVLVKEIGEFPEITSRKQKKGAFTDFRSTGPCTHFLNLLVNQLYPEIPRERTCVVNLDDN